MPPRTAMTPSAYGEFAPSGLDAAFAPRKRSEAECCLAKSVVCKSIVSCCHCRMHRLTYISCMSTGVLKRSFIALIVLALTSAWQVSPSFASRACNVDNAAGLAASGSCIGHCKSVAGDCTKATVCCSISTNLALPFVGSVTPIDWDRLSYPDNPQSLTGRSLEPGLHPPNTGV